MRILFHTLGCKANQSESASLAELLTRGGHTVVTGVDAAPDAVIINTCTVTQTSDQKSRQAVRRLSRAYPGAVIAVCGCMTQIDPQTAINLGAALVGGTSDRRGFIEKLEQIALEREKSPFSILNSQFSIAFEPLPASSGNRTRVPLKIQDGCDNHCTYCIIPRARGASRSLPPDEVYKTALEAQCPEIVLTGIEISSYGAELENVTLIDAVKAVHRASPGSRIRLGSLEPRSITEGFLEELVKLPVCPHFHLSLQSGCDAVLKRMGRRYDTRRYLESCELVRTYFPACAVTTDLITGFPGETETDHAQTLEFIERCNFADMHIFPYSRRENTPAAVLPGQHTKAVKQSRAREAGAVSGRMSEAYRDAQIGKTLSVLFETERGGVSAGTSQNYLDVGVSAPGLRGCLRGVLIESADGNTLFGRLL